MLVLGCCFFLSQSTQQKMEDWKVKVGYLEEQNIHCAVFASYKLCFLISWQSEFTGGRGGSSVSLERTIKSTNS